jgi:hypothetical protein
MISSHRSRDSSPVKDLAPLKDLRAIPRLTRASCARSSREVIIPLPRCSTGRANSFNASTTTDSSETFGASFKPLFSAISTGRRASFTKSKPSTHTIISLRLFSNHGHPSAISLSEIDVLGADQTSLSIDEITFRDHQFNLDLMKLINGQYIKPDPSEIWEAPWPPDPKPGYLEVILLVSSTERVEYIRLWPNTIDPTKSVREVRVVINDHVFDGEVTRQIATTIHVPHSAVPATRNTEKICDNHGEIPIVEFTTLEVIIWESHAPSGRFGLSRIRFHDLQGRVIETSHENCKITAEGCGKCSDLTLLFDHRGFENDNLDKVMWAGKFAEGPCRILVKFEHPVQMSVIEVINGDMAHGEDYACKNMQMLVNGMSVWTGRLTKRTENSTSVRPRSTFVWLFGSEKLRRQIGALPYDVAGGP